MIEGFPIQSPMTAEKPGLTFSVIPDDFDLSPFAQQGGLGRAYQLFGNDLPGLLEELNEVLVA